MQQERIANVGRRSFKTGENESRGKEASSALQRGLVYLTWLTNRLKSLIFIKETRLT
jgi:hypothetical protein